MMFRKTLFCFCLICLCIPVSGWCRDLRVLVVHSNHAGFAWTEDQQKGFFDALEGSSSVEHVDFRVEYLDARNKSGDPAYGEKFYAYLQYKYSTGAGRFSPDLIYATDDDAVEFLQRYAELLFPKAPIVFSGLNNLELDNRLDHSRFYGVFKLNDVAGTISLALRLEPSLKTVYFIGDDSSSSHSLRAYVEKETARFFPQVKVAFYDNSWLEKLKAFLVKSQPKLWVVTSLGGVLDAQGERVSVRDALVSLNAAGDSKILAMKDIYLTSGVLGGAVNRGREQGLPAGKSAAVRPKRPSCASSNR